MADLTKYDIDLDNNDGYHPNDYHPSDKIQLLVNDLCWELLIDNLSRSEFCELVALLEKRMDEYGDGYADVNWMTDVPHQGVLDNLSNNMSEGLSANIVQFFRDAWPEPEAAAPADE